MRIVLALTIFLQAQVNIAANLGVPMFHWLQKAAELRASRLHTKGKMLAIVAAVLAAAVPGRAGGAPAGASVSNVVIVEIQVEGVSHRLVTGSDDGNVRAGLATTGPGAFDGISDRVRVGRAMDTAPSVTRTARVVSDPVHGTVNPMSMPGAVVEYCVAVTSAAGNASVESVDVTDTMTAEAAFDWSFGARVDGTVTNGMCNDDGGSRGSFDAGIVFAVLSDIAPGDTRTLLYRATLR